MYLSENEDCSRLQFLTMVIHHSLMNGAQYLTCTPRALHIKQQLYVHIEHTNNVWSYVFAKINT